jgi:uncharacterized protein (DUF169 family)
MMPDARDQIMEFGEAFGWPWVPVKFHREMPEDTPSEMRFCEAITEALRTPVVLTQDSTTCPGAKRSFGWLRGMDEGLAEDVARKQDIPLGTARKMVRELPKLDDGVVAVEVGTRLTPDVIVSYAQTTTAMKITRAFQKISGEPLKPVLSSVMAACGNAVVRCARSGDVALSFGCDQSRESGAIGRDRLMIGVPWKSVETLLQAMRSGVSALTA